MPKRSYILYTVLFVAVVVLLNLPPSATSGLRAQSRENLAPFQRVTAFVVGSVSRLGGAVQSIWSEPDKERQMLAEIAQLRLRVRELGALEQENRELRELVEFEKRSESRLVMGRVIARGDASGWWQTIRLNRGRVHGLGPGMAVLTPGGLVGHTLEVADHTADVMLITDPTSRVSCRLSRSGSFGIVRGRGVSMMGRERMEMLSAVEPVQIDYLDTGNPVYQGEEVLTSGLGGVYPEGILVGTVQRLETDSSRLFLRGQVVPAADFRMLNYVFVVTGK